MTFWDVFVPDECGKFWVKKDGEETQCRQLDSVPYDDVCDEDYVRRGLIGHDGFPSNIIIVKSED